MEITTWGIGMTRIEFDAHRCQSFLRKMSVQRTHYCLFAKAVRFYKTSRFCQNIGKYGQNTYKSDTKMMFNKNNFHFKAAHFSIILHFWSGNAIIKYFKVKCKKKSATRQNMVSCTDSQLILDNLILKNKIIITFFFIS